MSTPTSQLQVKFVVLSPGEAIYLSGLVEGIDYIDGIEPEDLDAIRTGRVRLVPSDVFGMLVDRYPFVLDAMASIRRAVAR